MQEPMLLVLCGESQRRERFVEDLSSAGWKRILSTPLLSEAVRALRGEAKACVIVDSELEDVPGLKAVPILQGLNDQMKIIFTAPQNTRDLEAQVRKLDVFYYYLSAADSTELAAAVRDAIGGPERATTRRPLKVLIVDDDPVFHATVRTILQSAGCTTISAYSQREGLETSRTEKPDIILLDIIMETSTDGFEFCREARRDPSIRHTPILGISAIEDRTGIRRPPDADPWLFPVDGYLSKPVTPEALLAELARLVPGRFGSPRRKW